MRTKATMWSVGIAVALGLAVSSYIHPDSGPAGDQISPAGPTEPSPGDPGALLATILVAPPHSGDDYDRNSQFGGWIDADHDGCNTRMEILDRDADVTYGPPRDSRGRRQCKIDSIRLIDPYGQGELTSTRQVQIDHIVPLKAAWRAGADGWDRARRVELANDPRNLLAVDGGENESKGDRTPDQWMPAPRTTWCLYASRYAEVTAQYELTLSARTKDKLANVLATAC